MKKSIYQKAKENGCHLTDTCVSLANADKVDQYMKGTRIANRKKVIKAAFMAGIIDEDTAKKELKFPQYNPYTHYVSKYYIVYVNSAIEHFIKVN